MPDLGLSALGDDQLVDLLNEAVGEILSRDPVVRKVAQSGVLSAAQKRDAFLDALKVEIASAKSLYEESVRQDVRAEVARAIHSGEMNVGQLVGSTAEAQIVADCTKEQIEKLKEDLARSPTTASFAVQYDGKSKTLKCSYHSAGQNWDANRNISGDVRLAEKVRMAVLGAFGIPTA